MEPRELSQAYAGFVRRQCGADGVAVLEFHRLTGGAIQNNYALTVDLDGGQCPGRKELVVRSDAPPRIAASLDRAQAFPVLNVAYERSEERRVGEECVSTGRSRGSQDH